MDKHVPSVVPKLVFALLLLLPTVLAATSPLQTGRDTIWIVGTLAGVLAMSLLVMQVLLPSGWLNFLVNDHKITWHRVLGISITVLVLAHVVGLYLYSPDDIGDALILAAPTYSRLGVLSAGCLLLSLVLALARQKLPLIYTDWQILHSALAVAVVGTAIAHVAMLQGTLDGFAEGLLCGSIAIAVVMSIAHWYSIFSHR
jgi:predicted ferric reductase